MDVTELSIEVGNILSEDANGSVALSRRAASDLQTDLPPGKRHRRPFHWVIEFPEVFIPPRDGFDALVGNPPFMGDKLISTTFGSAYKDYLSHNLTLDGVSTVDVVVFFFLRAYQLMKSNGKFGFLARRSLAEGKNRESGLEKLLAADATIYCALTNLPWPGKAPVQALAKITLAVLALRTCGKIALRDYCLANTTIHQLGLCLCGTWRAVFRSTGFKIRHPLNPLISRGRAKRVVGTQST